MSERLMPAVVVAHARVAAPVFDDAALTPREIEVARWIAECKSNHDIGSILGISTRTVGKHRDSIFAKVGVGNRAALTRWFVERAA